MRTIREGLFSIQRRQDESLSQYVARRTSELQAAEAQGVSINGVGQTDMLEEGARLGTQGVQHLRTICGPGATFNEFAAGLRRLDTSREQITGAKSSMPTLLGADDVGEDEETMEPDSQDGFSEELDDEDVSLITEQLESMPEGISEDQVMELFLEVAKRPTWSQARAAKREQQ